MRCPLCLLPNEQEATFATLFRLDFTHEGCQAASLSERVEEQVPLSNNTLEIVWFRGTAHPLHFQRILQDALHSKRAYLFYEPNMKDSTSTRLLAGLLFPLRIYAERFLTLDDLASLLRALGE